MTTTPRITDAINAATALIHPNGRSVSHTLNGVIINFDYSGSNLDHLEIWVDDDEPLDGEDEKPYRDMVEMALEEING
jgi:hypothetical protein